jgi:hypothetical protein
MEAPLEDAILQPPWRFLRGRVVVGRRPWAVPHNLAVWYTGSYLSFLEQDKQLRDTKRLVLLRFQVVCRRGCIKLVLGAGYIGLEFAQMMHRFGSKVTVIERSGQILSREDAEVAEALANSLRKEWVEIQLNATVEQVRIQARTGDAG